VRRFSTRWLLGSHYVVRCAWEWLSAHGGGCVGANFCEVSQSQAGIPTRSTACHIPAESSLRPQPGVPSVAQGRPRRLRDKPSLEASTAHVIQHRAAPRSSWGLYVRAAIMARRWGVLLVLLLMIIDASGGRLGTSTVSLPCSSGFGDCNKDATDGCEVRLAAGSHLASLTELYTLRLTGGGPPLLLSQSFLVSFALSKTNSCSISR
jgi:hypothetical protein